MFYKHPRIVALILELHDNINFVHLLTHKNICSNCLKESLKGEEMKNFKDFLERESKEKTGGKREED